MLTHIVRLPNGKAYELQTWLRMEDDDTHQPQAP